MMFFAHPGSDALFTKLSCHCVSMERPLAPATNDQLLIDFTLSTYLFMWVAKSASIVVEITRVRKERRA